MRVFISNFGKGNSLWPGCIAGPAVAAFDDAGAHRLWLMNDKEAYVEYCLAHTLTQHKIPPTRSVAARWFNLVTIVTESDADYWFHREKDEIWWTITQPGEATSREIDAPIETGKPQRIVLYHKPCQTWSNTDKQGRKLTWNGLHPKARTFMFTEGTLQELSADNAAYALALIEGEDRSRWESRTDWKAAVVKAGHSGGTLYDARRIAIMNMAIQAEDTCKRANGQKVERTAKDKRFESRIAIPRQRISTR